MKQVAGTLRITLAQYRELADFSQFASDLDEATRAQLSRGERMVELLKQAQYHPYPVEKQVAIIFCGIDGLLDDVPAKKIQEFEKEFLAFMETKYQTILDDIGEKKALDDDIKKELRQACEEFKARFE
jgi:F-type H+-transporting ATPase subunit alpha